MTNIFNDFPKQRPALPPRYAEIYEQHYKQNRSGATVASSASQKMESWLHRQVAKDSNEKRLTLELGAGTLNQLDYEADGTAYDIVEPFAALLENSPRLKRIRRVYHLIEDVPMESRYDRIISCAVLEHIHNLPYVVSKAALLLNEGGCFRAAVPSEGGFLWKMGYTLTTGLEFRLKYKLNYSVIMRHEHLNTVQEIERIIRCFFEDVEMFRLGVSKHLSLYTFFCAKTPNYERCRKYLNL